MVAQHASQDEFQAVVLDMMKRRGPILGLYGRAKALQFEAWVVTQPLTPERERDLYRMAGEIREKFPDIDFVLHVEHAGMYEDGNPFDAVPFNAIRFEPPTEQIAQHSA